MHGGNIFILEINVFLLPSTENMNKDPIVSKFRVPRNMFQSSGFSFKVKEKETLFLKELSKKLQFE